MPKQKLAFTHGGDPRLELEWGSYMRDFSVRLDGEEIGRIDGGQRVLKTPHNFSLPDGSELTIQLNQSMLIDELEVLHDGQPLPGSASNPRVKLSAGIRTAFFWGIACIIIGALIFFTDLNILRVLSFSQYSFVAGLLLMPIAIGMSKRSLPLALFAIVVYLADWAGSAVVTSRLGVPFGFLGTIGMLARGLSLVPLVYALGATRLLQQKKG
ncbi:MAG: hypothetical protein ACPG8W_21680 [Candidatus Promineifilaceae bacterium]